MNWITLLGKLPDFSKATTDAAAVEEAFAAGGLKAALPVYAGQVADYEAVLVDLGVPAPDAALVANLQKIMTDANAVEAAIKTGGFLAAASAVGPLLADLTALASAIEAAQAPAAPQPASRSNEPEGQQPPGP